MNVKDVANKKIPPQNQSKVTSQEDEIKNVKQKRHVVEESAVAVPLMLE